MPTIEELEKKQTKLNLDALKIQAERKEVAIQLDELRRAEEVQRLAEAVPDDVKRQILAMQGISSTTEFGNLGGN